MSSKLSVWSIVFILKLILKSIEQSVMNTEYNIISVLFFCLFFKGLTVVKVVVVNDNGLPYEFNTTYL